MGSLYSSNADLLAALCILAPENNVRIALVGLIDFLEDTAPDIVFDRMAIFEVVARGVVQMNFEMDDEDGEDEDAPAGGNFAGKTPEEALEEFRKQLGTDD